MLNEFSVLQEFVTAGNTAFSFVGTIFTLDCSLLGSVTAEKQLNGRVLISIVNPNAVKIFGIKKVEFVGDFGQEFCLGNRIREARTIAIQIDLSLAIFIVKSSVINIGQLPIGMNILDCAIELIAVVLIQSLILWCTSWVQNTDHLLSDIVHELLSVMICHIYRHRIEI